MSNSYNPPSSSANKFPSPLRPSNHPQGQGSQSSASNPQNPFVQPRTSQASNPFTHSSQTPHPPSAVNQGAFANPVIPQPQGIPNNPFSQPPRPPTQSANSFSQASRPGQMASPFSQVQGPSQLPNPFPQVPSSTQSANPFSQIAPPSSNPSTNPFASMVSQTSVPFAGQPYAPHSYQSSDQFYRHGLPSSTPGLRTPQFPAAPSAARPPTSIPTGVDQPLASSWFRNPLVPDFRNTIPGYYGQAEASEDWRERRIETLSEQHKKAFFAIEQILDRNEAYLETTEGNLQKLKVLEDKYQERAITVTDRMKRLEEQQERLRNFFENTQHKVRKVSKYIFEALRVTSQPLSLESLDKIYSSNILTDWIKDVEETLDHLEKNVKIYQDIAGKVYEHIELEDYVRTAKALESRIRELYYLASLVQEKIDEAKRLLELRDNRFTLTEQRNVDSSNQERRQEGRNPENMLKEAITGRTNFFGNPFH